MKPKIRVTTEGVFIPHGVEVEISIIDNQGVHKHNGYQKNVVEFISNNGPRYGKVDGLNPDFYNNEQLIAISLGRGSDKFFGNIDDLDPEKYSAPQMKCVAMGRGNSPEHGNIDDLNPMAIDADHMYVVSIRRGSHK